MTDNFSLMTRLRQFNALTKPRVIQLIVFCALIGMVLAVPGVPTWDEVQLGLWSCVGIWFVAGAAAAFNCIVEKKIDAVMKRTAWRPTAKGELSDTETLVFSGLMCAFGSWLLYVWVNPLTMWLTFATFVGYAVIYTVILKPLTPQNIVIGGASGAMPPVLGWAAMTGDVGPEALILFLIIFLWTPRLLRTNLVKLAKANGGEMGLLVSGWNERRKIKIRRTKRDENEENPSLLCILSCVQ